MHRSVLIALGIAVIAGLWILSGLIFPGAGHNGTTSAPAEATVATVTTTTTTAGATKKPQTLASVRVRTMQAEDMTREVRVTGRSQASRAVTLKAETEGQVSALLVEKGAHVEKGDILARIELRDRKARVTEAVQLVEQRQIQFNAASALEDKGYNSRVRLAESRAQLEAARAQLEDAQTDLDKTAITAPFEGIISDQFIEIGDYLSEGDDIFSIVDLNPLEIHGFLTERQIQGVVPGKEAKIRFLGQSDEVRGTVAYVAPAADPLTRTFHIEVSLENPDGRIPDGLTASIRIPVEKTRAYRISPSILSLADDGTIGVKIVDADDIVRFVPVALIMDTPKFLWVGNLPAEARIVTVGQDFVVPGQKVRPVESTKQGLL